MFDLERLFRALNDCVAELSGEPMGDFAEFDADPEKHELPLQITTWRTFDDTDSSESRESGQLALNRRHGLIRN